MNVLMSQLDRGGVCIERSFDSRREGFRLVDRDDVAASINGGKKVSQQKRKRSSRFVQRYTHFNAISSASQNGSSTRESALISRSSVDWI